MPGTNQFHFSGVTVDEVSKLLSKLDGGKATGLDNISPKLLKIGHVHLAKPLAYIMNLSLSTGIVPSTWKISRVSPIFKEGDPLDTSNYRPISVIPACMKIFEKVVPTQLYDFMQRYQILSSNQSGFRPMHSTQTCLVEVCDYLLDNMSEGFLTGAVFLDLKKAFDTVHHEMLIKKLISIGVQGRELDWFSSYLTEWYQVTKVNDHHSNKAPVNFGVPQCSVLGPLLFTLYINDLPGNIRSRSSRVYLYADWDMFRQLRNSLNILACKLKRDHFTNKIDEAGKDSGKLWSTLEEIIPNKKQQNGIIGVNSNGEIVTSHKDIANCFNSYFSTVGQKLADGFDDDADVDADENLDGPAPRRFMFTEITPDEVYKQLMKMPSGKATGLDDISPRLLKAGAPVIAGPLASIMNMSIRSGVVPAKWKQSRATPIFKEGDRFETSNCRPISVIPAIMKVFERLIHDQLYDYLQVSDIMSHDQSGFRPGHSTQTCLLDVSDYLLQNIDEGMYTGAIFLDLKKRSTRSITERSSAS